MCNGFGPLFWLLLSTLSLMSTPPIHTSIASCGGSGFYYSKHFNHTNVKNAQMFSTLMLDYLNRSVTLKTFFFSLWKSSSKKFVPKSFLLQPRWVNSHINYPGKCLCFLWLLTFLTVWSHRSQLWRILRSFFFKQAPLAYLSCQLSTPFQFRELTEKSWCLWNLWVQNCTI